MLAALLYLTKTRLALTTLAALGYFFLAPRWDCSWQVEQLRFQSLRVGLSALDLEMDVGLRVWVRGHLLLSWDVEPHLYFYMSTQNPCIHRSTNHNTTQNPNHVPARLINASLALFRVQPPPSSGGGAFLFPSAASAAADSTAPLSPAPPPSSSTPTPVLPPVRGPAFGSATIRRPQRVPRRDTFFLEAVHVSLPQLPLTTALAMLWELLTGCGRIQVRAIGTTRVRAARNEVAIFVNCLEEVRVLLHTVPQITRSVCAYTYAVEGVDGGVGSWLEEGLASMDFDFAKVGKEAAGGGGGGSVM